jgi:hypothetical protein
MAIIPLKSDSFSSGITLGDDMVLQLVTGNNADGRPSYAILLLPAHKVNDLKIALPMKNVILDDYGKVMANGEGYEPPEGMIDDIMGLLTKK